MVFPVNITQPFFVASQKKTVSLLSICFARMMWFCIFLKQNNFYKWRQCFPRLMAVPPSQHSAVSFKGVNDSIIEQNIHVFFSFAFLLCVCLCSRKKKWTTRCPLLCSLVYLQPLFWCFAKSDKINNYWNVKAVFCFLSKSANSFKAWKTTTTCSFTVKPSQAYPSRFY